MVNYKKKKYLRKEKFLMEENKKLVTILVPAYNEEEVLYLLYERLVKLMDNNHKYN